MCIIYTLYITYININTKKNTFSFRLYFFFNLVINYLFHGQVSICKEWNEEL